MVAIGFFMLFTGKSKNTRHYGNMVMGLGLNASKLSVFVEVGCAVRTMKIPTYWHFGAHGAPYHGTDFP